MPVQEQVLSSAFGGQDLYVQSQTGTGKTAAFLIVIFQRLLVEPLINGRKAIIMVPTRELAVQVEEEAKQIGKFLPFKVGSFYGGVGYTQQQQALRDNAQILVGTPGRVLDLNKSGYMNLMDIAFLILDEADRMFDMGFYPDLRKLIRVIPPADKRQTMLFSATLNAWVKNLAWEYTKSPLEIEIAPETVTVEEIDQVLYHVPSADKMRLLMGIFEREKPESALIFCNTKRYTEIVAKRLRINGIDCEFIIGDLPQTKRLKIIDDVKAGKTHYLVATDVAARGLDIDNLSMVINYDLPVESENYVHRIGRTGRAGLTGKAVTLASEQDVYELPAIERYIGKKIPSSTAEESLFAEDKSEGMRIHTDVYEDRHSDSRREHSGRRGPPGRDHGRGRERPSAGSYAGNSTGSHAGSSPERGRRHEGGNRRQGPHSGDVAFHEEGREHDRHHKAAPRQNSPELTKLSLEERMSYYKDKYAGEGGPGPAEGREQRGGNRPGQRAEGSAGQGSAGPRSPRPKRAGPAPQDAGISGEAPSGRDRGRKGQNVPGQHPEHSARGRGQGRSPGQEAAKGQTRPGKPEQAAAPKKGLLGRLLGVFKKKSD
jgi:ATP-dependent RNA helicase RhlB